MHTTADDFCQISFPFLLFILFGSSNRGASDTIVLVLAAAAAAKEEEEEEEDLFIIFSYGMKQSG
jgi:general stress protein CsbA